MDMEGPLIMHLLRWYSLRGLIRLALVLGAFALVPAAECQAGGLLPVTFDPNQPLILATDGSVTYDQTSGDFNVQATGLYLVTSTVFAPITGTDLATLDLTVDHSGNLVGTGSLTVTGAIDIDGDGINDVNETTVLTGKITALGTAPAGPAPWEFDGLMSFTGGALTQPSIPLSGGGDFTNLFSVGELGAFDLVVEQQVSGILGDFSSSFSGNTIKQFPAGVPTPEPATVTLAAVALTMIAGWGALRRLSGRIRTKQ
jgi:hypothetical protein